MAPEGKYPDWHCHEEPREMDTGKIDQNWGEIGVIDWLPIFAIAKHSQWLDSWFMARLAEGQKRVCTLWFQSMMSLICIKYYYESIGKVMVFKQQLSNHIEHACSSISFQPYVQPSWQYWTDMSTICGNSESILFNHVSTMWFNLNYMRAKAYRPSQIYEPVKTIYNSHYVNWYMLISPYLIHHQTPSPNI